MARRNTTRKKTVQLCMVRARRGSMRAPKERIVTLGQSENHRLVDLFGQDDRADAGVGGAVTSGDFDATHVEASREGVSQRPRRSQDRDTGESSRRPAGPRIEDVSEFLAFMLQ